MGKLSPASRKIISGDIRTAARIMADIDNGVTGAREVLKEIFPYTGRAYIIGITGAPGVGKSTLVDRMASRIREDGKTLGILAVDPTSPFSGGALLGDRVRMQRHSMDDGVFIRSMATRGHFGGITGSTRGAIDVLDAMGKDYIIVETVGTGQDETDIVKSAHTTVVVLIPGMGDSIQAIKSGIFEIGDIFVINKSEREGAEKTLGDLTMMIEMGRKKNKDDEWNPPVLKMEALHDKGIKEFMKEVEKHRKRLMNAGLRLGLRKNRENISEEIKDMVRSKILEDLMNIIPEGNDFNDAVSAVERGDTDPYSASDNLAVSILKKYD